MKVAFAAAVLFAIVAIAWLGPIRLVERRDPELALAPLGFQLKSKAFTGVVYERRGGLRFLSLTFVYKGERHGPDIQWYDNGQRFIERHYSRGLEVGQHKAWFEDGSVKSLKNFTRGVPDGEFFDWHANGNLAGYVLFEMGKEIAAKSWTAGGKPFYNYVWKDTTPVGLQGDSFCAPQKNRF